MSRDAPSAPLQDDRGPAEPWLTCVAPLILFLAAGALEPTPSGGLGAELGIGYAAYPAIYTLRLTATAILLARVWPHIRRWLGRPGWWPPLLGLLLVVPWVALAKWQDAAGWTLGAGERSGFNPLQAGNLGPESPAAWAFLVVRALGLIVIVPIVEELFVRGFLMRYVIRERFWEVPFGTLTAAAVAACTVYAALSHPNEALAAIVWFGVVTAVAATTRKPIDCVLCHAGTNLALGAYVLASGEWWLL